MSRCHTCANRFACEGDDCHYRPDPWPRETRERWEEYQAELEEEQTETAG